MESEMLAKIYGEFCSLRGEMSEFKRRTLERLEELERNFRQSSVERTARLCRAVSVATGIITIASAAFTVAEKFLKTGGAA